MTAPLSLLQLDTLIGPNIYSPHAGVFLSVTPSSAAERLLLTIKELAQAVGLVIGAPQPQAGRSTGPATLPLFVPTADPALAADLCRAAVAEINTALTAADAADDADPPAYDAAEVRWQLQRRRRRNAPPLRALQLLADARRRDLLARLLPDGSLLLGSGRAGLRISPAQLADDPPSIPDWPAIGHVPIVAVSGADRRAAAARITAELHLPLLADPSPDTVLAALADADCRGLVLTFPTADLLSRGLPISFCHAAVVTDAAEPCPADVPRQAWLDAVGLPVLIARGPVLIGRDPQLQRLSAFAAAGSNAWPPEGPSCFPDLRPLY
jgi:hypothetical protein